MTFHERNDDELARLSDEELVAYIVAARRAGATGAAVTAAQILAYRYERRLRGFVQKDIGDMGQVVCEEAHERIVVSAIGSAENFAGSTIKEFRAWLWQIARRRIADLHRERARRVDEVPIERPGGEGEDREFGGGDAMAAVDQGSIFQQAYNELNAVHKLVIVLVRLRDLPHREAAIEINRQFGDHLDDPMSEQNVSQINSRFSKELKRLDAEAEKPPESGGEDD